MLVPLLKARQAEPSDRTFSVIHNIVARIHSLSTGQSTFALVVYFRFGTIGQRFAPFERRGIPRDARVALHNPLPALKKGFMERAGLLQDNRNGSGTAPVASEEIQKDGLKTRADMLAAFKHRQAQYGLPCANCKAYYASDLPACPICHCAERVSAEEAEAQSARMLKTLSGGMLQPALRSFINLDSTHPCGESSQPAVCRDEDRKRLRLQSKLLLFANPDESSAGTSSPCILDKNHNTHYECASVCLSCYDQLREKLTLTEAALHMDVREAAQVIYEAVWADPAPMEPSRTYQNAAQALLNELRYRAGIAASRSNLTPDERSATVATGLTGPGGESIDDVDFTNSSTCTRHEN